MEDTQERALSRPEAAARLGISTGTLRRLVIDGELPPPRQVSPGRFRHLESELNAYLRSRPTEPLRAKTARAMAARHANRG